MERLIMTSKAIVTCALTGVLTDPNQHPVPVTPEQMAREAKSAFDAGATVMHVHFRSQVPGMGRMPSWEPQVAHDIAQAIREACPGVIFNQSTGVVGPDIAGPLACMERIKPEMAACNAGSLNYLKATSGGTWAWPPMLFDNPVAKIDGFLQAMAATNTIPEFECFDVGIVRCIEMFHKTGLFKGEAHYNFVMGVESGMPADPALLPILLGLIMPNSPWQVTAIGRANIWPLHQKAADLGGHLRSGLEDTFYLPDGSKAGGNAQLIEALVQCARNAGRDVANVQEARQMLGLAGGE